MLFSLFTLLLLGSYILPTSSCSNCTEFSGTSGYTTNAESTNYFTWAAETRTAEAAFLLSFPNTDGTDPQTSWPHPTFSEGVNPNQNVTQEEVVTWVKKFVTCSSPFKDHQDQVPIPQPANNPDPDQLGPNQYVTYSRAQICFILAKTILGANTDGYNNGLLRFANNYKNPAMEGDFGRSWWLYMASCARDPAVSNNEQGPILVAAKASPSPTVDSVRAIANDSLLSSADLRVCAYDHSVSNPPLANMKAVPSAGCQSINHDSTGPGTDFMTGGLTGQATQDISAAWLGGYVFGNSEGLGGGQDERLLVYFPELVVFAFFLSENSSNNPQLRQPGWILGARPIGIGLDGTARFNLPVYPNNDVPMTSDLVDITLGENEFQISSSRPFIFFQSINQGYENGKNLYWARLNKEYLQRDVSDTGEYNFNLQVLAWYHAVALDSYATEVKPALLKLVSSIGVGPWLAGLWFGDSHLGLIATWIGHAMASKSWGGKLSMDYYIYSSFTENPGNQCFVHSKENCQACLDTCYFPDASESVWLPSNAYMDNSGNVCVVGGSNYCPDKGIEDVYDKYKGTEASQLWDDLVNKLTENPSYSDPALSTVFDILLN